MARARSSVQWVPNKVRITVRMVMRMNTGYASNVSPSCQDAAVAAMCSSMILA
ncbi:hypothetical protein ACH4NT_04535 [Streptomyces lydicus]|uniref:hypothetical protein n=1 Tax=Streptomyces lydicus TaxID=47763 RepID=UPI0037B24020